MYKIYGLKLKNEDKIRYIGYTGKTLKKRLSRHFSECNRYNHKNANWIKKHKDLEGIDIVLIEDDISSLENAWELEIKYIKEYREIGYDLNNSTDGGEGVSGELASIRLSGEGNPFYGKIHTKESKIKMSEKGKERTGELNGFYGKKHKKETKDSISKTQSNKYNGEGNPFYGKNHTIESKIKMSVSSKNKTNKHSYKGVLQIDINNNNILKIWDSISEASKYIFGDRKYGTYITSVCKGRKKQAGGYYWRYLDNESIHTRCNTFPGVILINNFY